jgi:hypothetical protein
MYYLIYTSKAINIPSEEALRKLMQQCLPLNKRLSISGLLIYINGCYLQVLEGEKKQVLDLYDKIRKDERHDKIITLIEGDLTQCNYPQWTMEFIAKRKVAKLNFVNLANKEITVIAPTVQLHPAFLLVNQFYKRLRKYNYSY